MYPNIFGKGTDEGSIAEQFFDKWGWYATVYQLAGKNLLNMEAVFNTNIHELLTFEDHRKDRDQLESFLREEAEDAAAGVNKTKL